MKSLLLIETSILLSVVIVFPVNVSADDQGGAYDKTLMLNGISFHVSCVNDSSLNKMMIGPLGLEIDNSVIKKEIDGIVTGAEVDDLNGDGSPEIYVFINSVGSGSYGSLVAYSSNNKKSLSEIYMPPLTDDAENSKGYMGHDQFTIIEGSLTRLFPIYKKNDTNANPTGGMRQLEYKLVPGEASWLLKLTKSTIF